MNFSEYVNQVLHEYVGRFDGNAKAAAKALGVSYPTLWAWLKGTRKPSIDQITAIFDRLEIDFESPISKNVRKVEFKLFTQDIPWQETQDQTREVCFVDAKVVRAGQHAPPIIPEEYVAVPLVSEAGAGPGIIPEEEFRSWVLVYRNLRSIARRSNLIAVEVGKNSRSMVPLLHPGDIVLVDLDDKGEVSGFAPPGNTYLVREPGQEGGGRVKRVSVVGTGERTIIIYYSENSQENEPEPYFLKQDFDDDLTRAIVGKVVWAWTDIGRK